MGSLLHKHNLTVLKEAPLKKVLDDEDEQDANEQDAKEQDTILVLSWNFPILAEIFAC